MDESSGSIRVALGESGQVSRLLNDLVVIKQWTGCLSCEQLTKKCVAKSKTVSVEILIFEIQYFERFDHAYCTKDRDHSNTPDDQHGGYFTVGNCLELGCCMAIRNRPTSNFFSVSDSRI